LNIEALKSNKPIMKIHKSNVINFIKTPIREEYQFQSKLGKGSYGVVYDAI